MGQNYDSFLLSEEIEGVEDAREDQALVQGQLDEVTAELKRVTEELNLVKAERDTLKADLAAFCSKA